MTNDVPQPSPERMVPVGGHPFVMGIVPNQPALVALTAAVWATACGASHLYCAYVDGSRFTAEEYPGGTVRHLPIDPDGLDNQWRERQQLFQDHLEMVLAESNIPWTFRYLAGRPDRALTHLARAVDAAALVVGTRPPGHGTRLLTFVEGSVAFRLSHHQHRPVLVVPLEVVDWEAAPWR